MDVIYGQNNSNSKFYSPYTLLCSCIDFIIGLNYENPIENHWKLLDFAKAQHPFPWHLTPETHSDPMPVPFSTSTCHQNSYAMSWKARTWRTQTHPKQGFYYSIVVISIFQDFLHYLHCSINFH